LVVDDELTLQKLLKAALERHGYFVRLAATGLEALTILKRSSVDLILLDIMLPDKNGFEICQELRRTSDIPVVMLTALNRPEDVVRGFNLGADDYITKPFRMREVLVRIDAILRRVQWSAQRAVHDRFSLNGVSIDERSQTVTVRGKSVHLTPIEYRLLRYLMSRADRPIPKDELFQNVWGYAMAEGANLVEVAIRRLRSKIEVAPSHPQLVLTVHAVGYKFVASKTTTPSNAPDTAT
jgi:DNA-binding response OmpR family regulator